MKRRRILLIALALCALLYCAAAHAETDWSSVYANVYSQGSTNPSRGTLLEEDCLGKVLYVQDRVGGWFRMVAPQDGDYVFSVLAPNLKRSSFSMEILLDGEYALRLTFERSDSVQSQTLQGVKEGQVIAWWDNDDSGRGYTLQDPFKLMISTGSEISGSESSSQTVSQDTSHSSSQKFSSDSSSGSVYFFGDTNLRSGPGLGYEIVSTISAGKSLVWLGEGSIDNRGVAWYKVRRKNGESAWVSSRYSQLNTSDGSMPDFSYSEEPEEESEPEPAPEPVPVISSFSMSSSYAMTGDAVLFTFDIANAEFGAPLKIEFCANDSASSFNLVYPANVFKWETAQPGVYSVRFRICGEDGAWSDYCEAQTLTVEEPEVKIESISPWPIRVGSVREKAEGETIEITVSCSRATGVVELYAGDHYVNSGENGYVEQDGKRIFTLCLTLGGNGEGYTGSYPISVRALPGMYTAVEDQWDGDPLIVEHNTLTMTMDADGYYKNTDLQHMYVQQVKVMEMCSICHIADGYTEDRETGMWEDHVLNEDESCSVCGYRSVDITAGLPSAGTLSEVKDYISISGAAAETQYGSIRYVSQGKSWDSEAYIPAYWENVDNPDGQCSWAVVSMMLSYWGLDITPSDIQLYRKNNPDANGNMISYYKAAIALAKEMGLNIQRVQKVESGDIGHGIPENGEEGIWPLENRVPEGTLFSELDAMLTNYQSSNQYSPVFLYIWRMKKDGTWGQHAVMIVGKETESDNTYFIVDPGAGGSQRVCRIVLQPDANGVIRFTPASESYVANRSEENMPLVILINQFSPA